MNAIAARLRALMGRSADLFGPPVPRGKVRATSTR